MVKPSRSTGLSDRPRPIRSRATTRWPRVDQARDHVAVEVGPRRVAVEQQHGGGVPGALVEEVEPQARCRRRPSPRGSGGRSRSPARPSKRSSGVRRTSTAGHSPAGATESDQVVDQRVDDHHDLVVEPRGSARAADRVVGHPVEADLVAPAAVAEDDPVDGERATGHDAVGIRTGHGAVGEPAHPHDQGPAPASAGSATVRGTQPITMVDSMPAFLWTYCFLKSSRCLHLEERRPARVADDADALPGDVAGQLVDDVAEERRRWPPGRPAGPVGA